MKYARIPSDAHKLLMKDEAPFLERAALGWLWGLGSGAAIGGADINVLRSVLGAIAGWGRLRLNQDMSLLEKWFPMARLHFRYFNTKTSMFMSNVTRSTAVKTGRT
jgi:hypothetical protein